MKNETPLILAWLRIFLLAGGPFLQSITMADTLSVVTDYTFKLPFQAWVSKSDSRTVEAGATVKCIVDGVVQSLYSVWYVDNTRIEKQRSWIWNSYWDPTFERQYYMTSKVEARIYDGDPDAGGTYKCTYTWNLSVIEVITTPSTPSGPSSGETGQSLSFSTSGSISNLGHSVEYRFDWGDGTFSSWGSATQSHSYSNPGNYQVKAQARCVIHTSVTSSWSASKSVSIVRPKAGVILEADPDAFTGSAQTVIVSVKNLGRDDNNLIVKAASWPSGWSVSPSSKQTRVPYNTTNNTYFFFTVTPPSSTSGSGTIVWELYYDDFTFNTKLHTYNQSVSNTPVETITTPSTPSGPSSGETGQSLSFSTSGSISNLGHSVEYRFDWGDGTFSSWGSASQSKSYSNPGTYQVKAQARCVTHTLVSSSWSASKSVSIVRPKAGVILEADPDAFTGSAQTVIVSVKNLGRDDNNLIVKAASWPSGWSVSPSSKQTKVPYNTTNNTYFTFTVTPPSSSSSGTIVWELYYDDFTFNTKLHTYNQSVSNQPNLASFGGTVTDASTGSVISGASVSWGSYSTTTNTSGVYSFNNVPCQTATLTVSKSGYQTSSQSYTPVCNASNVKNVSLGGKETRLTAYDAFGTAGESVTLEAMIETKNLLGFWDSVGGLTVDFYVEGVKQGSAVSTSTGKNLKFTYAIPSEPSKHPLSWYAKFNGDATYNASQSANASISFRAGKITSVSPNSFSGSAQTVTVSVKNLGRDDNNLIVKAASWPSGWSVSPSSKQTKVPYNTTNNTYFTFTVTPPSSSSSGTIVWELYYDDFTFNTKLHTYNQSVSNQLDKPKIRIVPTDITIKQ